MLGCGGTHFLSQNSGGRGKQLLSYRLVWSTQLVLGHPGLYRETLCGKTNKQKKNIRQRACSSQVEGLRTVNPGISPKNQKCKKKKCKTSIKEKNRNKNLKVS